MEWPDRMPPEVIALAKAGVTVNIRWGAQSLALADKRQAWWLDGRVAWEFEL